MRSMLSQLIFDERVFEYLSKTEDENNHVRIISRILHQLRGSIAKFVLDGGMLDANHTKRWILFLSQKGIKLLNYQDDSLTSPICFPEVDYNTTRLLHLRSVIFECLQCSENEVCLIKYLLACSPFLKKIVIRCSLIGSDEKFMFAKKLLMLHRASPVAEIDLFQF